MPKITIRAKNITVDGKRCGVRYDAGPWVAGVDATTIKVRPRASGAFPAGFRDAFAIENASDGREDYFEKDCIRVTAGHPQYRAIAEAAGRA